MRVPRVLLIEDDPTYCSMYIDLLKSVGFDTIAVETARDAVDLLEKTLFDKIICDNSFPYGSPSPMPDYVERNVGLELLTRLRAGAFGEINKQTAAYFHTDTLTKALATLAGKLGVTVRDKSNPDDIITFAKGESLASPNTWERL